MNKLPLVAIVVPVYNVELYLKECIESIIAQTYKNYICIIVDDGSTDSSPLILKSIKSELDHKNNNFIFLHKINEGVSSARNYALDYLDSLKIQIDYITFVDSDDFISNNFLKELMSAIITNKSDFAICAYQKFDKRKKINNSLQILHNEYSYLTNEELTNLICKTGNQPHLTNNYISGGAICNKCFKYEYINSYRFDNNIKFAEDLIFWLKILHNVNRSIVIPKSLYFYRMRKTSLTHDVNNDLVQRHVILFNKFKILKAESIQPSYIIYAINELILKEMLHIAEAAIISNQPKIAKQFFNQSCILAKQLNFTLSEFYVRLINKLFKQSVIYKDHNLSFILYKYLMEYLYKNKNHMTAKSKHKLLKLKLGYSFNKIYIHLNEFKKKNIKKNELKNNRYLFE